MALELSIGPANRTHARTHCNLSLILSHPARPGGGRGGAAKFPRKKTLTSPPLKFCSLTYPDITINFFFFLGKVEETHS